MSPRFKFVAIAAVFVSYVGGARITNAAPPANACSLLTSAQVSDAVGTAVDAGTPLFASHPKDCQWRSTAARTNIRVQLFLKDAQALTYAKIPISGKIVTGASGVGDDAVYTTFQGTASVMTVKKGDVVFDVHVLSYGMPDDKVKAIEKTLALKILAKL